MAAAKEATIEVLIPDVHNEWDIYDCLDRVLEDGKKKKKPVKRVFHLGDLRQDDLPSKRRKGAIYYDKIVEFSKGKLDPQLVKQTLAIEAAVFERIREVGEEVWFGALYTGKLRGVDKQLMDAYATALKIFESVGPEVFEKESLIDYAKHEERIAKIKKKHAGVAHYGVPGNHDTKFIKDQVKSVDWLVYDQKLKDEGIVGALVCREDVGEMQGRFNGPGLKYAPIIDDDYRNLEDSQLYKENKGKKLDLIVSHCGGHWGEARDYKGGLGITKLGEENPGMVNYAGHDHDMIVYRDPKTKVLTIRPGTNYVAKVFREGKKVKLIEFYRIRQPTLQSLVA